MGWLASLQGIGRQGDRQATACCSRVLSVASALSRVGVLTRFRRAALWAGIVLSLVFWLLGQGMGDLKTTQATDPNAGPLFILLALTLMPRRGAQPRPQTGPHPQPASPQPRRQPAPEAEQTANPDAQM